VARRSQRGGLVVGRECRRVNAAIALEKFCYCVCHVKVLPHCASKKASADIGACCFDLVGVNQSVPRSL
jgi:hypothetical protein